MSDASGECDATFTMHKKGKQKEKQGNASAGRFGVVLRWTHDDMMQLAPSQVRGWASIANNEGAVNYPRPEF